MRQRFIESITYLRKMGFFEEYSNLTSEEIFEKRWGNDILLKDTKRWMSKSTYEIDRYVVIHDPKRVWSRDVEMPLGNAAKLLKELSEISRGAFQSTDIKEGGLKEVSEKFTSQKVSFTYNSKKHMMEFVWKNDFLLIESLLHKLNRLIEKTGYCYYLMEDGGQFAFVIVLTKEEASRLIKERGWKIRKC